MARSPSKVARRYARALFEAYEPAKVEAAGAAIFSIAAIWESNRELREVLVNPGVPVSQRQLVVEDIANKIASGDVLLGNFSKLLIENGRISLWPEISAAFSHLVDLYKKRLALEITSAFELDGTERESILERVRRDFGGLASVEWRTDSTLIGGLRIKAGDLLLDSSVAGALQDLRENLVG